MSTYDEETHATDLHAQRDKAYVVEKPEKPRAMRRRPLPPRRCGTRANISSRSSITTRWNCLPTTVVWNGDGKLTVYDKTQGVQNVQRYVCSVFGLEAGRRSCHVALVGRRFGSGLRPQYQVVLAMLGALQLKRSVRLVLTRDQMYGLGYRPATIQRVALGAQKPTGRSTRSPRRRSP